LAALRSMTKIAGSGSISQRHWSRSIPKCHGSATLVRTYHQKNAGRYGRGHFYQERYRSFSSATSCSRPRLFLGKGDSGSRVKEEEEEDEKESVPGPYSAVLRSSAKRAKVRPSVGPEWVEQFPVLLILIVQIFSRKCALVKARQRRNRSSRILLLVLGNNVLYRYLYQFTVVLTLTLRLYHRERICFYQLLAATKRRRKITKPLTLGGGRARPFQSSKQLCERAPLSIKQATLRTRAPFSQ